MFRSTRLIRLAVTVGAVGLVGLAALAGCSSSASDSASATTASAAAASSPAFQSSSEAASTGEAASTSTAPGAGDPTSPPASGSATAGSWPRTVTDANGDVEIAAQPQRVVSTSVVLTGSLLALDAPVVGSGASGPNTTGKDTGLDENGFFAQWGDIAVERGVEVLYTKSELDLEAVQGADPDLIIVSATGGDSQVEHLAQLQDIAPVYTIDYNAKSWQEVTTSLGEVLGLEQQAADRIATFEDEIASLKAKTAPPTEPVQMIVFNPADGSAFALPDGPHDQVISELGFTLAELPASMTPDPARKDFVFASEEASIAGLTAKNVLLVDGDDATVTAMQEHAGYSRTPSVADGTLVPLGHPSFKLDYYSALDMAENLAAAYPA